MAKYAELELERDKLGNELESVRTALVDSGKKVAALEAESVIAQRDTIQSRTEVHELKAAARVEEKRRLALEADLGRAIKDLEDLKASMKAEVDQAYQEGADNASGAYAR